MFKCTHCNHTVLIGNALNHYCWSTLSTTENIYANVVNAELSSLPSQMARKSDSEFAKAHVHTVITACGFDSTTTTIEAMDASDVRLICRNCTESAYGTKMILTWRAAVSV